MDLDGLNDAQVRAVRAADGAHLVIAGAGTGKTRTLVHRVAWLLAEGVDPREIVLLTFTRRAAAEMLQRVERLVGLSARGVRGGTFHGFSNQVLRRHAAAVGLTPAFTILDRGDAEDLVGSVRAAIIPRAPGERYPQKGTVLDVWSKHINTGRPIQHILDTEYPQYAHLARDVERIGDEYTRRKLASDVVDYDDLLVHLAAVLREHPSARERISALCRYVLVDEYQDTNRLQGEIAALLASVHGNLMVVGDEAQSIYGFRGAEVENILNFPKLFPGAEMTVLEQNYRSVQPILDLANGVLDTSEVGYRKRLFTEQPGGERPTLVRPPTDAEEAQYVAERVLALREDGAPLSAIAVLFRNSFHANALELELTRANIPFRKFGGMKFLEAGHTKDVFALLRLVVNPRDAVAWVRVLRWLNGVGATTADRLVTAALAGELAAASRGKKWAGEAASIAALLDEARGLAAASAQVSAVVAWYRDLLPKLYEDNVPQRTKDVETLAVLAEGFADLTAMLSDLAVEAPTQAEVEPGDTDEERLVLSTIHSAKGLEWDHVFILRLLDGAFPSAHALADSGQMEEERRLLYVAVTRARQTLTLLQPRLVRTGWGMAHQPGCRLTDDIPDVSRLMHTARVGRPIPLSAPDASLAAAKERTERILEFYRRR